MPDFRRLLAEEAPWIFLSTGQLDQLQRHYDMLRRWNTKMNLTSVEGEREIVRKHFAESLFLALQLSEGTTAVDLGSGGGFPGIPVAIAHPEIKVTLLESDRRKAIFLREASLVIAPNLRVEAKRSEDLDFTVDWLISRAVRPEQVLETASRVASKIAFLCTEAPASPWPSRSVAVPVPDGGIVWLADVPRGTSD